VKPRDAAYTVDDLADLPDDGLQYELAEGTLLVTPSPRPRHQRMSLRLASLLSAACPDALEVFVAPLDFQPSRHTSLQPDLLVVRRQDIGEERIAGTPLLVVEILSPSTRAKDLLLKRGLYADSGVPYYWVLDPDVPSALALTLVDGAYVDTGRASGSEPLAVSQPIPIAFTPADRVR
jgi:Uma2 family endonuclease